MAHLEGYVSHIRFHNEENGYTVLELETTHGGTLAPGLSGVSVRRLLPGS